jgi:hypothetical protein
MEYVEWAMLVPDLHCTVHQFHCRSLILVKKKSNYTYFHIHTGAVLTWSHAENVKKNGYLTLKQLQENVANTKSNRPQLQSCGNLKLFYPHKEQRSSSKQNQKKPKQR